MAEDLNKRPAQLIKVHELYRMGSFDRFDELLPIYIYVKQMNFYYFLFLVITFREKEYFDINPEKRRKLLAMSL